MGPTPRKPLYEKPVIDSWSALSEKTVFVLDRSPYFTHISSGHKIEGDFIKENKKAGHLYENELNVPPFDRSLWTCTVEAVVGYSRLVWDLFSPNQKCISILAVGPKDETLDAQIPTPFIVDKICSWNDDDQNLDQLLKSLAKRSHCHQIKPPNKLFSTEDISAFQNCQSNSSPVISSLDSALTTLGELTRGQIESKTKPGQICNNNGRIVLISSFQDEKTVNDMIVKFEQLLKIKNELLRTHSASDHSLNPINYCDFVIINTFPINDQGPCSKIQDSSAFKPNIHVKTFSVKSGRIIAGLLNNLCLQHYNLKSTTITGIPMKEEQNASSSSQYDVEIVHCSSIHEDILNSGSPLLDYGVMDIIDRNGFPCVTFKLGWCTPRSTSIELNHCVATSRITAVDVNSRPSACLTNFLLNGRQVMLEIAKSKTNRMTTHILASHGGELYIHSLATGQHKLNLSDPPSINDSLGGKVSDYRSNEFQALMKKHVLVKTGLDDSLARTCKLIKRQTLYWPIAENHTVLMNVPTLLGEIVERIPKESLSQADLDECKRAIDNLCKAEKEGQALPPISLSETIKLDSTKSGTSKPDQLYNLLWNELEYFLRVHSTTPEHGVILDYMHEKHSQVDRGTKRAPNKLAISASSPIKRQRSSSIVIPELSDASTAVVPPQIAMFYKTGVNLYQTWSQLYHRYHRGRSKLQFVGRTQQTTTTPPPPQPQVVIAQPEQVT